MSSNPTIVKQVIVVRKDLNMRKGKIAAQAAHASMAVLLNMMEVQENGLYQQRSLHIDNESPLHIWLNGAFTKVCVSVNSEEELVELHEAAKQQNIPAALIVDNGLTEFNGVKTTTCLAIGPDYSERINMITGGLQLL